MSSISTSADKIYSALNRKNKKLSEDMGQLIKLMAILSKSRHRKGNLFFLDFN